MKHIIGFWFLYFFLWSWYSVWATGRRDKEAVRARRRLKMSDQQINIYSMIVTIILATICTLITWGLFL